MAREKKKKAFKKNLKESGFQSQSHKWCSFDVTVSVQKKWSRDEVVIPQKEPTEEQVGPGIETALGSWARFQGIWWVFHSQFQRVEAAPSHSELCSPQGRGCGRARRFLSTHCNSHTHEEWVQLMYSDYQDKY